MEDKAEGEELMDLDKATNSCDEEATYLTELVKAGKTEYLHTAEGAIKDNDVVMDDDEDKSMDPVKLEFKNPLDLSEIREVIFKFLNRKDLIRCRIVNNSWCFDSTKAFQKSSYMINLNERSLGNYIKFINSGSDHSKNFKYNIKVRIGVGDIDADLKVLDLIRSLGTTFGTSCIQALSFRLCINTQEPQWKEMLKLIQCFRRGLEILKIHEDEVKTTDIPIIRRSPYFANMTRRSPWTSVFQVISNSVANLRELYLYESTTSVLPADISLTGFPNLTSLYARLVEKTTLLVKIIKVSPKLKNLALLGSTHIEMRYHHNMYVVEFLNECFTSNVSLENLETLDIGLGNAVTYNALQRFHFCRLQTLKVHVLNVIDIESASIFNNFLRNNCPELQRLEFDFCIGFSNNEFVSCLPDLPNLRHFGYMVKNKTAGALPEDLLITKFEGIANKFPSLESVSTSLGLCFYSYASLEKCNELGVRKVAIDETEITQCVTHVRDFSSEFVTITGFTGVRELNLTITEVDFNKHEWCPSLTQNVNQLVAMFPNLKKLVINNKIHPSQGNIYQKIILRELLGSFDGIEELEFINYNEDWLSQVIYESPTVVQNLKGLRHIKIPDIERWCESSKCHALGIAEFRPFVCLTTFLKYLPSLELLQVASSSNCTPWTAHLLETDELRKGMSKVQIQYL